MKLTQSICISILTFISTSTFAISDDKLYLSGHAGIFGADFNNRYLDQTDTIKQNIAQSSIQNGYIGGIALGYSRLICQNYFMGGELSANIDSSNASFQSGASTSAFSDQIKIEDHFDLTFVPGLLLTNTIATYLKLGISYAHLEDKLTSPAGFTAIIANYHSNKNVIGFAAGLGIAKSLTEHIAVFTEADYHDYGKIDFSNFQNFSSVYSHSTHVYSYAVMIGATYTL